MIEKTNFQKEIEKDEKRLREIYDKILKIYSFEEKIVRPEDNCIIA